jgi:hypothetical protein
MTRLNCSYKCISHFTCFDINLNWTWHIWTVPTNFKIIRRLKVIHIIEMESENWVEGPRRSVYFFFHFHGENLFSNILLNPPFLFTFAYVKSYGLRTLHSKLSKDIGSSHNTRVHKILLQFITIYWFENNYFSIFCHQTKKKLYNQ